MHSWPKVKHRLAVFSCELLGLQRPARKLVGQGEDDGGIRLSNIHFGALQVIRRRRFRQQVLLVDSPTFRLSALGTPAAMGNFIFDRPVQPSGVGTGLTS